MNLASESHFHFSEVLEISEEKEKKKESGPESEVTKPREYCHEVKAGGSHSSVLSASLLSVSSGICDTCWKRRDTNMNDNWSLSPRAYLSGGKQSLRGIMVA